MSRDVFYGEQMKCTICGKVKISDPIVQCGWVCLLTWLSRRDYPYVEKACIAYGCTDCQPLDTIQRNKWADFYEQLIIFSQGEAPFKKVEVLSFIFDTSRDLFPHSF